MDSEDTDAQDNRLATTRGSRRYASDELRFTGIDMGGGRARKKYAYQHSDDDDNNLTESDSQATTENETEDDVRSEMENALVQSALARIRKARAKGKQDVKLNKGEVAALERRRKRLQAEADAAARKKETDRKRGKDKEQRIAVPLSHFDPQIPHRGSVSTPDDPSPRQRGPPVGMFSPPNASQLRPRSSASSHHSSFQRHGSSSPFDYQYVSGPPDRRYASDIPPTPSPLKTLTNEADARPQSSSSPFMLDPFQYQTGGPSRPYPASATDRSDSGEVTPEFEDEGSFNHRDSAQIGRNLSQEDVIVVETATQSEKELERPRGKKTTSRNSSLGKRIGGSSRRRRDR